MEFILVGQVRDCIGIKDTLTPKLSELHTHIRCSPLKVLAKNETPLICETLKDSGQCVMVQFPICSFFPWILRINAHLVIG